MNQTQKKYAMERINAIRRKKMDDAQKAHTKEGKSLDWSEKIEMIRLGAVPFKKVQPGQHTYLRDTFDFSEFERDPVKDSEAIALAFERIYAEADRIKDEIMLGDAEHALEAIKAFSAMSV